MANHHEKPPQVKEEKRPRLFYYEEAVGAWIPMPEASEKALKAEFSDDCLDHGDEMEIRIRCYYMTDAEVDALPEVSYCGARSTLATTNGM